MTTASALAFFAMLALHAAGFLRNPYSGLVAFVLVPALFVLGLLLIPIGLWRERRRPTAATSRTGWPRIDLNDPTIRRALVVLLVLTLVNVGIVALASYGAVEYTESNGFCGQVCHQVMEPEFVAHRSGAHARVECVTCHVGPGAGGFLSAKVNGTRQMWLAMRGTHSRPIPTPVETLPDVQTSCEQCHRPDRFVGDKEKVFYEHADDEANTPTVTKVRLHVGGPIGGTQGGTGIHWHMNRANEIEYVSDHKREKIDYVRVATPDGRVREYFADNVTAADVSGKPRRRMDCLDCHNRPAHRFSASPEREVDAAIGTGQISPKVPFIRREAVRALRGDYATRDAALREIDRSIRERVNAERPGAFDEAELQRAIGVTQAIYGRSVFPSMKVGWGTYPTHMGHTVSNGCFRCHDDGHKTAEGVAIRQECELCHAFE